MNLAALLASAYLFTFSAPLGVDKSQAAEIVRSAAASLGCVESSVEFEPPAEGVYQWRGTVRCRRWKEQP